MTTKKFSELTDISTGLGNDDIFAVTDIGNTESKKLTALDLTNFIFSDSNIESKRSTIITKINALNPSVGNGLQAQKLFFNGSYQEASALLAYTNISGKPTIPTALTDLNNAGQFISLDTTTTPQKVKIDGTGSTAQDITSDYITEGSTNLYYTNARVDARQSLNFGTLFNTFSSTFDGGESIESLQDVSGTFQSITSDQSRVIRITDKTLESKFLPGQLLRVYGASANTANSIDSTPTAPVATVTGFTVGTGTNYKQFSYHIAYFNLITGEVSKVNTTAVTINVYNGDATVLDKFNTDNFVKLQITGQSATQGVLVYRKIIGTDTDHKLLAVLGPKDLQSDWKDYHTFDYTSWSGKSATDNTFTSITHFPLTAPTAKLNGWTDVTISSINSQAAYFELDLGSSTFVYVDAGGSCQVAHNDTNKINDAIISKSAQGKKSVVLNAKTYNASHISIPDNFGLIGTANITKVKKLPWTGYSSTTPNNSIVKSGSASNATSISLVGIDIDGNLSSQYLHNDDNLNSINYSVDLGANPSAILIDRCRIKNVVGGGVYATSPVELKISTSEIVNSGVTDRHLFSPLIGDNGTTTILTSNRFENFTDSVDVSVTSEGVVSNNIVKSCGSGLFTYGSTFFLSSPNVLIGAANEFLSSPDILNSEYDSINIFRSQLPDSGAGDYNSDTFVYQENGAAFDLSQTADTATKEIVYRTNLIRKLSGVGSEEIYGNTVGPGATSIAGAGFALSSVIFTNSLDGTVTCTAAKINVGDTIVLSTAESDSIITTPNYSDATTLKVGAIQAGIPGVSVTKFTLVQTNDAAVVSTFANSGATGYTFTKVDAHDATPFGLVNGKRYVIQTVGNTNWTAIGAKEALVGVEFVYNNATVTGTSGVATSSEMVGYAGNSPIVLSDITVGPVRTSGEFKFQIANSEATRIKSGIYSQSNLKSIYDAQLADGNHPAGSSHVGIAWSASYRYAVNAGAVAQAGTWSAGNAGDPVYTVKITPTTLNVPLRKRVGDVEGTMVSFKDHANFAYTNSATVKFGEITNIANDGDNKILTIIFYGGTASNDSGITNTTVGTASGNINIIDDFVMAQGLIK